MNWKRLGATIGLILVVSGGTYAFLWRREKARQEAARNIARPVRRMQGVEPNRSWRWPSQSEWAVHQVMRDIASWALTAENLEQAQVQVRRKDGSGQPGTFDVAVITAAGRYAATIRPRATVWEAAAYVDIARALAGAALASQTGAAVAGLADLLLASDSASLRKADRALFAELSRRPRDPQLHEQAALLWTAHALRESDGHAADDRPFLNGAVAHLALSRAFAAGAPYGAEAEIASAAVDALLLRQTDAMEALSRTDAQQPDAATAAWSRALRLRITSDPRAIPTAAKMSRLEKLEAMRALSRSESCRRAVDQAKSWRLPIAADWVRATASGCREPEFSQLAGISLDLQAQEAAELIDARHQPLEKTVELLREASLANTHQPAAPTSVVGRHVRADAGARHILSGFALLIEQTRRFDTPRQAKMLSLVTESIVETLPLRPLFEMALERAAQSGNRWSPSQTVCQRFARLVADRPDLLTERWWTQAQYCQGEAALRFVPPSTVGYGSPVVVPGTGWLGSTPWQDGIPVADGIADAAHRAPWNASLAARWLRTAYKDSPPTAILKEAYVKLLDYNVDAMASVLVGLHDADDEEVQRLAEHICALDVEQCGTYADYLASIGRDYAAEKMWRHALAEGRDEIALSNTLGRYVNLLLDRGRTEEALRLAQRAADVYSGAGLRTLAVALERLGRFDEAAREYAKITERYGDGLYENAFYIRYRQRYGGDRFANETQLAMAAIFPDGLHRKSLADFRREHARFTVTMSPDQLTESLRRAGVVLYDAVAAVDGFEVLNPAQFQTVLTFTDDPPLTMVLQRPAGAQWSEISGSYRRWKYGQVRATQR